MRIIITGASGFIGKNLLLNLPADWEVIAIYNSSKTFTDFLKKNKINNVIAEKVDLFNQLAIQNLVRKQGKYFDACIYLAANGDPTFSVNNPIPDIQSNTISLINFIELLNIKKLIYFSSGAVYDGLSGVVNPKSKIEPGIPYAISKLATEQYIKFFKNENKIVNYAIIRFFGAYGPYEPSRKIFNRLIRNFAIKGNNAFNVRGDGENLIDAMYIEDTIEGIKLIVSSDISDVTVDFASGDPITINELVYLTAKLFGHNNPSIIHEGYVNEYINFKVEIKEFQSFFKFKPKVPLADGLMKFYNYLKDE